MFRYKLNIQAEDDLTRIFENGMGRFRQGYRYCVCGVDTIFYKISPDEIEIMAIIGRQNFI